MKGFGPFGFLFLFFLTGTVSFVYLGFSSNGGTASNPGMASVSSKNAMTLTVKMRKLKGNIDPPIKDEDNGGRVNLEDYRPIDPVPSSTASIRPGPIQHGTPLMPYIPKPSPPPSQEKHGVFP
ncbi:hypothetical protein CDL12_05184 [Handroanthus impetiginosus]|uniref:Uncharacterized protein n=1 Tax=Handroanthus impetiginosus TaxID=429701 RepID=A0A2G9HX47_9LAMI|nr:hypothetical protein CDL12_05184 [Handroanthus impetiginosus]